MARSGRIITQGHWSVMTQKSGTAIANKDNFFPRISGFNMQMFWREVISQLACVSLIPDKDQSTESFKTIKRQLVAGKQR